MLDWVQEWGWSRYVMRWVYLSDSRVAGKERSQ